MGSSAPGIKEPSKKPYDCAHTALMAHARGNRIYESEFKRVQGGKVGISIGADWNEPATEKPEDIQAAERSRQFAV